MIIKQQEVTEKLTTHIVVTDFPDSDENPYSIALNESEWGEHHSDEALDIIPKNDEPEELDPYTTQPLNPILFEQGKLIERREPAVDRRQGFRRDNDALLLSSAEHESQKIKAQAQQQGFEEGLERASHEVEKLKQVIQEFTEAREQILNQAVSEIAGMATEIAKQILKIQIETAPETVVEFVKKAIAAAGKRQKFITVRLHPSDLPIVDKAFEEKSPVASTVDLTLLEDVSVDPGSCIIETQSGQVDKRFSTQLEVLERLMQKEGLL